MNIYRAEQFIRPDLQAHISSEQLILNVRNLRSFCPSGTQFCAVVKANAYGHGISETVGILKNYADAFAVATFYEALHIAPMVGGKPILILEPVNPAQPAEQIQLCARHGFHCVISSLEGLAYIHSVLAGSDMRLPLHLNVETGMGRCGLDPALAGQLLEKLPDTPNALLVGVMTHFATADEEDLSYAFEQLMRFEQFLKTHHIKERRGVLIHACNSAATIKMPQAHYTMVRCGISMYGYYSRPMPNAPVQLKPALRLQAPITQLRHIPKGSPISYGRSFVAPRDTRVGIIPLGYADGYRRCFSNKAMMKLGGRLVPVIGRVCMDQVILDVTDCPNVQLGDWVTVIDDNHESPCGAYALAEQADTICYEILTLIHAHVSRIVH